MEVAVVEENHLRALVGLAVVGGGYEHFVLAVPVDIDREDVFDRDGHCSYSPDRNWVLTDTYPSRDDSRRTLILYRSETDRRVDIGRFYSDPAVSGPIRCDLHPRWSRDGRQVCVDSIHEGSRQMYVIDVTAVTGGPL